MTDKALCKRCSVQSAWDGAGHCGDCSELLWRAILAENTERARLGLPDRIVRELPETALGAPYGPHKARARYCGRAGGFCGLEHKWPACDACIYQIRRNVCTYNDNAFWRPGRRARDANECPTPSDSSSRGTSGPCATCIHRDYRPGPDDGSVWDNVVWSDVGPRAEDLGEPAGDEI